MFKKYALLAGMAALGLVMSSCSSPVQSQHMENESVAYQQGPQKDKDGRLTFTEWFEVVGAVREL